MGEKKAYFTQEEQDELKKQCDHVGAHGPATTNVIVGETNFLLICTHVCMTCGKQMIHVEKVELPKEPAAVENYLQGAKKNSPILT